MIKIVHRDIMPYIKELKVSENDLWCLYEACWTLKNAYDYYDDLDNPLKNFVEQILELKGDEND